MRTKVGAFSVIGGRKKNEDSLLVDWNLGLYAVADGVGGGLHGDVASRMVIDCIRRSRTEGQSLRKGFELAHRELLDYSETNFGDALMGTTLTAVEVKKGGIQLVHVGDSRAYQVTPTVLRQLSEDHEKFEEFIRNTVLSEYLGMPDEMVGLKIQAEWVPMSGIQRFLLSTDGLHRQLSPKEILEICIAQREPEPIAQQLCMVASEDEESDNVTVIFLEVEF